jgi:hypothetical protein
MAQAWLRLTDYGMMTGDTAAVIARQTGTDQEKSGAGALPPSSDQNRLDAPHHQDY